MTRTGWHYGSVDAVRSEAGVGDQTDECCNGTLDCPGPDADIDALPCFECLVESREDNSREVATDGGHDIDLEELHEKIDHLVRITGPRSNKLHLAGEHSTVDEPQTLCWEGDRDDVGMRGLEFEHFDDETIELLLCGRCSKRWLGTSDSDTSKFGRSPADVLAENGFENGGERA